MSKAANYRHTLQTLTPWEPWLANESGLPGPRANLELVQAVADTGTLVQFHHWLSLDDEFLALCGTVGLGRIIAEAPPSAASQALLDELRRHANDPRWRVREGVAMALQRLGARNMPALLTTTQAWRSGSCLERRAVVAALCEPALVRNPSHAAAVLDTLNAITASLQSSREPATPPAAPVGLTPSESATPPAAPVGLTPSESATPLADPVGLSLGESATPLAAVDQCRIQSPGDDATRRGGPNPDPTPSTRPGRADDLRVLRQALGYGWSVAIVGNPPIGKPLFEHWCQSANPDIRWLVRENLKKKRLTRMDAAWVASLFVGTRA